MPFVPQAPARAADAHDPAHLLEITPYNRVIRTTKDSNRRLQRLLGIWTLADHRQLPHSGQRLRSDITRGTGGYIRPVSQKRECILPKSRMQEAPSSL